MSTFHSASVFVRFFTNISPGSPRSKTVARGPRGNTPVPEVAISQLANSAFSRRPRADISLMPYSLVCNRLYRLGELPAHSPTPQCGELVAGARNRNQPMVHNTGHVSRATRAKNVGGAMVRRASEIVRVPSRFGGVAVVPLVNRPRMRGGATTIVSSSQLPRIPAWPREGLLFSTPLPGPCL